MGNVYSLSRTRLKVLLMGCGYDSAMGVLTDDPPLENEDVISELNAMVNCGILCNDGDSFSAVPELKRIIDTIGSARLCWYMLSNNPALPDKCIFKLTDIVSCSVRPADKEHVVSSLNTIEDLTEALYDEGYLVKTEYKPVPPAEKAKPYEDDAFDQLALRGSLYPDSPIVLSVECMGEDKNRPSKWLRVIDYYYCKYIAVCEDGCIQRIPYNKSNIRYYMKKMIENDIS